MPTEATTTKTAAAAMAGTGSDPGADGGPPAGAARAEGERGEAKARPAVGQRPESYAGTEGDQADDGVENVQGDLLAPLLGRPRR